MAKSPGVCDTATEVLDPLGEALNSDAFSELLLGALQETARAGKWGQREEEMHRMYRQVNKF